MVPIFLIKKIYAEFLGYPGSKSAKKYLRTNYIDRSKKEINYEVN